MPLKIPLPSKLHSQTYSLYALSTPLLSLI